MDSDDGDDEVNSDEELQLLGNITSQNREIPRHRDRSKKKTTKIKSLEKQAQIKQEQVYSVLCLGQHIVLLSNSQNSSYAIKCYEGRSYLNHTFLSLICSTFIYIPG